MSDTSPLFFSGMLPSFCTGILIRRDHRDNREVLVVQPYDDKVGAQQGFMFLPDCHIPLPNNLTNIDEILSFISTDNILPNQSQMKFFYTLNSNTLSDITS